MTCVFAFATILGWGLYGAKCCQYIFGHEAWNRFALVQSCAVILGTVLDTSVVWTLSEIVNGLMAIPNLIALVMSSGVFLKILKDYQLRKKAYSLE